MVRKGSTVRVRQRACRPSRASSGTGWGSAKLTKLHVCARSGGSTRRTPVASKWSPEIALASAQRSRDTGRAMSQENVAVVQGFIEASGRSDLDALMAALDPTVEWTPVESDPDYAVHRGHDDVRAWLIEWAEALPD